MANFNSTQYAKVAAASTTYDPLESNESAGRIRVQFFHHATTAEAVADTISLCRLPKDARVVDFQFCCTDLSTAGAATLAIGDSGDPDRLVAAFDVGTAALAINAATTVLRTPTTAEPDIGFGYKYTDETVITATVAAFALTAGNLWGAIFYVVD